MPWILDGSVKVHEEGRDYMRATLEPGDAIEVRSRAEGTFTYERRIKALEKELADEQADMEMIVGEVSKVYDEITGGRFSKPNTAAVYVIDAAEKWSFRGTEDYRVLLRALFTQSNEDGVTFHRGNSTVYLNDLTSDHMDLILDALAEVDDDA